MRFARRMLLLGSLGALAAALARRLRADHEDDRWQAEAPEAGPARPADAPAGQDAGTLEREGPRIGDEALASAVAFPDDATLRDRVESELFRDPALPKGRINVDAAAGVVSLRGAVEPALVEELQIRVAAVEGVVRVENLLTAAEPGDGVPPSEPSSAGQAT